MFPNQGTDRCLCTGTQLEGVASEGTVLWGESASRGAVDL
jgi:hypothetical protein